MPSGRTPVQTRPDSASRYGRASLLRAGPLYKRDLQQQLGVSRSTVYKAVRELEDGGLVEQTDEGHQLSLAGRLIDGRYREFFESVAAIRKPGDLLSLLPSDASLTLDALVGAEVIRAERHAPNHPVAVVEGMVEDAVVLRGLSPVALPHYVAVFRDQIVQERLTADLVLERPVVEYLFSNYHEEVMESLASDSLDAWEISEPLPFGLIVIEEPDREVAILVYDDEGTLKGIIRNDSRAALEWGRDVYESYLDDASKVASADV